MYKSYIEDNSYDNKLISLINLPIRVDIHEHSLIFCFTSERAKFGTYWICNKCNSNYSYETPSFYCTLCDFDLCYKCLGQYKLNKININNKQNALLNKFDVNNNFKWQINYSSHEHPLTLIKRKNINYSWKCNNCLKILNYNNSSFSCSLCNYNLCENCLNINITLKAFSQNNKKPLIIPYQNQDDFFQIKSFIFLNEEYYNNNLLYCPLPVQLLFTLLANGISQGNALNELKNCFSIKNLENENNFYINLLSSLEYYSSLEMSNTFFSKFSPTNQFETWVLKYFSIFSNNLSELNNFVEKKTHNKVKDYFKDSDLVENNMILSNVLYFNGEWKTKFKITSYPNLFYKSNGQTKKAQYIKCKNDYRYYKDDSIEAIEIPYKYDNMSALILLPNKSLCIDNIINKLNQEKLNILYKNLCMKEVELTIPKFKFYDSNERIDLKNMLKKMGIKEIFEFSNINFLPLIENNGKEHELFKINKVFQTNLLNVDENGTELISITTIEGQNLGLFFHERIIINMIVDRPFLFIIRNSNFKIGKDIILIAKIEDI